MYGDDVLVYDRTEDRDQDRRAEMVTKINAGLSKLFDLEPEKIIWKVRERQKDKDQYDRLHRLNKKKVVYENSRQYFVNLRDYLDTGLFLDHRPLRNKLNNLNSSDHAFISADVLEWLEINSEKYDTIFLDPPSFSNSKRMASVTFDVLRDQDVRVDACLKRLKPRGKLYFSTNHTKFRLTGKLKKLNLKDITEETIPFDFHNRKVHRCYLFHNDTPTG